MGLVSPKGEGEEEDEVQIQLGGDLWLEGLENLDGREDQVHFDLADWPEEARSRLRERLELFMVVSYWNDDTTLVVTEPLDPVYLDRVLNQVRDEFERGVRPPGGADAADGATSPVAPAAAQAEVEDEIGYDLEGWDEVNRSVLFAALEAEGIRYRTTVPNADGDGDELVVLEADEARVDELIDEIVEPDDADDGDDVAPELLGQLFVLADRLIRDPLDRDAQRSLGDKAEAAVGSRPPFGVERAWWQTVGAQVRALADLSARPGVDLDSVAEAATDLRDTLRPYV